MNIDDKICKWYKTLVLPLNHPYYNKCTCTCTGKDNTCKIYKKEKEAKQNGKTRTKQH